MKSSEKTKLILNKLRKEAQDRDLIYIEELQFGSGVNRCDFFTLHPHPSKGYETIVYEIKVSKQDFKNDTERKQRNARLYADYFYYVTPSNLIKAEKIPLWAGLIEYDLNKLLKKKIINAPYHSKARPSWELVVSIIRNSKDVQRDTRLLRYALNQCQHDLEKLRKVQKDNWKSYSLK